MQLASLGNHSAICQWLVLCGALNEQAQPLTVASPSPSRQRSESSGSVDEAELPDAAPLHEQPRHPPLLLRELLQGQSLGENHVDPLLVLHSTELRAVRDSTHHRTSLQTWAHRLLAVHHTFLHVFLRASVVLPRRRVSPRRRCFLPSLPTEASRCVAQFLGVEVGRRLRNVREFVAVMDLVLATQEKRSVGRSFHLLQENDFNTGQSSHNSFADSYHHGSHFEVQSPDWSSSAVGSNGSELPFPAVVASSVFPAAETLNF